MSYHLSYISPKIVKLLQQHFDKDKIAALLHSLSIAEIEIQSKQNAQKLVKKDVFLLLWQYVGYEKLQEIEEEIASHIENIFSEFWKNEEKLLANSLFNALHLIEPRLNAISAAISYQESWEKLGSRFEQDFIHKHLATAGDMWIQLLEQQRAFEDMPESVQKVDYVLEFPYPIAEKRGLWIEIDGEIHQTEAQKNIDIQRDKYAIFEQWLPVWRIKTEDFNLLHRQFAPLQQLLQEDYFRRLAQNYRQSLANTEFGLDTLQVLLSPVAIARIHKALIMCLLEGYLQIEHRVWRIAILEQDIPCGNLAIETFKTLCQDIFALEGENRNLPTIQVTYITTRKYEYSKLNKQVSKQFIADYVDKEFEGQEYDVLIDIAMLQRKSWNLLGNYRIQAATKVLIRSSFRTHSTQNIALPDGSFSDEKDENIQLANFTAILQTPKFIAKLLKMSKINTSILQNYYSNILENQLSTDTITVFEQQYAQIFANQKIDLSIFLQISNSALLLQIENPEKAIYKLWVAFALLVQMGNTISNEKTENMAENQLFAGFYALQLSDFEVFSFFYTSFCTKILQYIPKENTTKISKILQNQYAILEILPHINWVKKFSLAWLA